MDAAGDVALDRLVEVIKDHPEGPLVPRLGLGHESLDRDVVDGQNDGTAASLGRAGCRKRSGGATKTLFPPRRNVSPLTPPAAATRYPASSPDAKARSSCAS